MAMPEWHLAFVEVVEGSGGVGGLCLDPHQHTCAARVGLMPALCLQLKEKHRQSGGGVGALEELENAFSLAEESCPGISDKLMAHLVERVQR